MYWVILIVSFNIHVLGILIWASKASPTLGGQYRLRVIYIYMSVCMSTVCQNICMLKVSFGRLKLTGDTRVIHFDYTLEQL